MKNQDLFIIGQIRLKMTLVYTLISMSLQEKYKKINLAIKEQTTMHKKYKNL